jgi:hypothetical protein
LNEFKKEIEAFSRCKGRSRILGSRSWLRKALLVVSFLTTFTACVYFIAKNINEYLTETPKISEAQLVSNIGGTLSLFLGVNFLAIYRFFQALF